MERYLEASGWHAGHTGIEAMDCKTMPEGVGSDPQMRKKLVSCSSADDLLNMLLGQGTSRLLAGKRKRPKIRSKMPGRACHHANSFVQ